MLESRIVDIYRLLVKTNDEHSMVGGISPIGLLVGADKPNAR